MTIEISALGDLKLRPTGLLGLNPEDSEAGSNDASVRKEEFSFKGVT